MHRILITSVLALFLAPEIVPAADTAGHPARSGGGGALAGERFVPGSSCAAPCRSLDAVPAGSDTRMLSLEERIRAQTRIERVYHDRREWPAANPDPKPAFEALYPAEGIANRVRDSLRRGAVLQERWGVEITPVMLRDELARMKRESRAPETLDALLIALDGDEFLAEETLARGALTERLIRERHAADPVLHGDIRARAERARAWFASGRTAPAADGAARRLSLKRGAGDDAAPDAVDSASFTERFGPVPAPGEVTRVIETSDGFQFFRGLPDGGELEAVYFAKRNFDEWWSQHAPGWAPLPARTRSASRRPDAVRSHAAGCNRWSDEFFIDSGPGPRFGHTAIWTGTEMIVWGGTPNSDGGESSVGARFNPVTNSWSPISTTGAPSARAEHVAVWTGTEMMVWGGRRNIVGVSTEYPTDGALYDPVTDTWRAMGAAGAPPAGRSRSAAVWTGTQMVVWGGVNGFGPINTGGRYHAGSGTWTTTSTGANLPTVRSSHTAVWTGDRMIVWGGNGAGGAENTGGRYDPVNDTWSPVSMTSTPAARYNHTAVWTGSLMIVWGGDTGGYAGTNTGGRYDPVGDAWTATTTTNAPAARHWQSAVWSGTEMIVWGGYNVFTGLATGGRYAPGASPGADSWILLGTVAGAPRAGALTAVWSGTEMIAWGGTLSLGSTASNAGGRYSPALNSWQATPVSSLTPRFASQQSTVWTGAEMIIWGGDGSSPAFLNTGYRYDPATHTWTATSLTNAPIARRGHSAVWTGTEMIIWGGAASGAPGAVNSGGRYNPGTNLWTATQLASAPGARSLHTAVWSGTYMVVWGGLPAGTTTPTNTGGRYRPDNDLWYPVSTTGPVNARYNHTAIFTGTEMILWGGRSASQFFNSGGRYLPATDAWNGPTTLTGTPAERINHAGVWTGSEMIVWGGDTQTQGSTVATGGRYNPGSGPGTDSWSATSSGANAARGRSNHVGVWTGTQLFVWGGQIAATSTGWALGGLYAPAADSWQPLAPFDHPYSRQFASAAWNGRRVMIWGGQLYQHGGLYELAEPPSPGDSLRQSKSATVDLTWSAIPEAAAYNVKRCTLATGYCAPASIVGTPATNSYSEALDANSYFYIVEAVNACGATP